MFAKRERVLLRPFNYVNARIKIKEGLIKSVRSEYFPFAPSIHRASAALGTNGKCIEP